jgi:YidC/Oxa1 family membrane protein insertase
MDQEPDPQQEKRVLMAVVLSVAVLWVFSTFVFKPAPAPAPPPDAPTAGAVATPAAPTPGATPGAPGATPADPAVAASPAPPAAPVVHLDRAWAGVDSGWSSFGGSPNRMLINAYQEPFEQLWLPGWVKDGFLDGFHWERFTIKPKDSQTVNIVGSPDSVVLPVGIDDRGVALDVNHYRVVSKSASEIVFATSYGDVEVTKRYALPPDGYVTGYTVELRNVGAAPARLTPSFGVSDVLPAPEGSRYDSQKEMWAQVDGDIEHFNRDKLEKKERPFTGPVDWFGVADRYFMVGLEPQAAIPGAVLMAPLPGEHRFGVQVAAEPITLAPGEARSYAFDLYAGPKELDLFQARGMKMAGAVDFGFFGLLAIPILAFLKFIHGLVGSWGISIILLTVVIKGLLFPLSNKSYKSMKDMQQLQPEINALKEKHGDNREALNTEMMGLWKEHGVNPMGGCLPMVVQMPIWFALYRVLWNSVELYQTPFLYFIDLSLRDPIGIFPLLLGITMWAQQKFTPNTASDPAQQMVIKFMPLFFSVIMFTLPAGLVVYILVNNILSIAQQWVIHRQHGAPVTGAKATPQKA